MPRDGDIRQYVEWVSLPPLEGGLWVAMVTEVLDDLGIPNVVKTDLAAGGLGVVVGTSTPGKLWRIQVPIEFREEAMNVYESLMGGVSDGEASEDSV